MWHGMAGIIALRELHKPLAHYRRVRNHVGDYEIFVRAAETLGLPPYAPNDHQELSNPNTAILGECLPDHICEA
jgi:hypothetical protein